MAVRIRSAPLEEERLHPRPCGECDGRGIHLSYSPIASEHGMGPYAWITKRSCDRCNGTGLVFPRRRA